MPRSSLAPSEIVLLCGDVFAPAETSGGLAEIISGKSAIVAAEPLGRAILGMAILAAEQARSITLEQSRSQGPLAGYVKALFAEPAHSPVEWPRDSLEGSIALIATNLGKTRGGNTIANLVVALLTDDSPSPWEYVLYRVKWGLESRGLLSSTGVTNPSLFRGKDWVLPPETAKNLQEQPVGMLREILTDCERKRPEVWKLLNEDIERAIERRRQRE